MRRPATRWDYSSSCSTSDPEQSTLRGAMFCLIMLASTSIVSLVPTSSILISLQSCRRPTKAVSQPLEGFDLIVARLPLSHFNIHNIHNLRHHYDDVKEEDERELMGACCSTIAYTIWHCSYSRRERRGEAVVYPMKRLPSRKLCRRRLAKKMAGPADLAGKPRPSMNRNVKESHAKTSSHEAGVWNSIAIQNTMSGQPHSTMSTRQIRNCRGWGLPFGSTLRDTDEKVRMSPLVS